MGEIRERLLRIGQGLRDLVRPTNLLLALKTGLAAVLAWFVASILPSSLEEYRYYAPFGALISMSPILVRSLQSGVQILMGGALGIGLAWLAIFAPLSGVASLFLVVTVGIIISRLPWLGAGQEYVPIAALFVIVVGGHNADEFSLGFLAQIGLGAAVGFAVNLAILPPLAYQSPSRQLSALRQRTAETLNAMAEWVESGAEEVGWRDRGETLWWEADHASSEIDEAAESRRLNPRAFRHRLDAAQERDDLRLMQLIIEHVQRAGEILDVMYSSLSDDVPGPASREALVRALAEAADAVGAFRNTDEDESESTSRANRARERVQAFADIYAQAPSPDPRVMAMAGGLTYELGRIAELLGAERE